MTERYVELHASSAFSFLEAASQPEELIERVISLEMPAIALLDRNGIYGSARFQSSAKRNDIHAHTGAEVAVSDFGQRLTPRRGCRTSTLLSRHVCPCFANRGRDTKIYASFLRTSSCGKRPKMRVLLLSMTCGNMHLA